MGVPLTKRTSEHDPPQTANGGGLKWLNGLGRLPRDFDGQALVTLLGDTSPKTRQLAAANLGKLSDIRFLQPLMRVALNDTHTSVRREAVSAIGRMRDKRAVPSLARLTEDRDPKVVLQALRGLLVHAQDETTQKVLRRLENHPNELIQETIAREKSQTFSTATSRRIQLESPDYLKNLVVHGDTLRILKETPDESVHLTFTSPPYYNARDYSIYSSYAEYLGFLEQVFREVLRVTKAGRFFVLNTSPVIVPRVSRQHASRRYPIPFDIHPLLVKMGWEFIDDIVWVKPEASVKNRNGGFFQHRKPLAYKPNPCTEYLMVYRKKTTRLIDWNIRLYDSQRLQKSLVKGEYETTNVWEIDPTFDKTHSAVFPHSLCERVVRYYSFAEDLVYDPFGGSGTLGKAAATLGRYFFMTEAASEYIKRMRELFGKTPDMFFPAPIFIDESFYLTLKKQSA